MADTIPIFVLPWFEFNQEDIIKQAVYTKIKRLNSLWCYLILNFKHEKKNPLTNKTEIDK